MNIMISNDDGILAPGIAALIHAFAKTGHDIYVCAPDSQRSAASHSLTLGKPLPVREMQLNGVRRAWAIGGTPVDCVKLALLELCSQAELVVSGVNHGYNAGTDILYSGTVSAACEGVLLGVPAIALSTSFENYEHATECLNDVFDYIREHKLMDIHNAYNVNIPPSPLGVRITHQGGPYYSDRFPSTGEEGMYIASGKCVHENGGDLSLDTDAVISGYISIMPLTINRTDWTIYNKLNEQN
jgi:5'-nucleotidase